MGLTHFEALISLITGLLGVTTTLTVGVWKLRGAIEKRDETDRKLARAINGLASLQKSQHHENQDRFARIERRLGWGQFE